MPLINKALLTDVAELNKLINLAYRGDSSKKGWTTEADLLDGLRIDETTLTEYIDDANTTMLKYTNDSGEIEGCVYLNVNDGKVYIGMLTVNPELQNSGIGKQLLAAAEAHATEQGCHKLWMTVITTRYELIAYYQRKGFNLTGELKPFPTDTKFGIQKQPLELLVMEKLIN
jgi:ribosomal protein S18 acetylase RimI-like enzyme